MDRSPSNAGFWRRLSQVATWWMGARIVADIARGYVTHVLGILSRRKTR